MSPLPRQRGLCPTCDRAIDLVRRTGVLVWHRRSAFPVTEDEWQTCPGTGQAPKAVS